MESKIFAEFIFTSAAFLIFDQVTCLQLNRSIFLYFYSLSSKEKAVHCFLTN